MATFNQHVKIKHQIKSQIEVDDFAEILAYENKATGLEPGELAMLQNSEGIFLFTLNSNLQPVFIRPKIDEVVGVYIDEETLAPGNVLIWDENAGPENKGGWVNSPAPFPNLSGNSIFDLGDVSRRLGSSNNYLEDGNTLVWSSWFGEFVPGLSVPQSPIQRLADVEIDTPSQGQSLMYDANEGLWKNSYLPSNLGALEDVDLDTTLPVDGDALIYNGISGKWEAGAVAGGNANVVIIDESEPLPDEAFKTLGVSPLEDDGSGGNFWWVKNQEGGEWNKSLREGDVTFDDFKDVSTEGVQEGQTLSAAWNGTHMEYKPATTLAPGVSLDYNPDEFTTLFRLEFVGETGAQGWAYSTLLIPGQNYLTYVMGMYGVSPTEGRLRLSDDEADALSGKNCLKFPADLAPENGLLGVRPVTFEGGGVDMLGGESGFSITMDVKPADNTQSCILFDAGQVVFRLENGVPAVDVHTGDATYGTVTEVFSGYGQIIADQWSNFTVSSADVTGGKVIKLLVNDVEVPNVGGTTPTLPGNLLFPAFDGSRAVPAVAVGYHGYLSCSAYYGGETTDGFAQPRFANENASPDTWPTINTIGRLVTATGRDATYNRIVTRDVSGAWWTNEEVGQPMTTFGSSVSLLELGDVDTESFATAVRDGPIMWDADNQKLYVSDTDVFTWNGFYYLNDAEDVSRRLDDGSWLDHGQILAWNDFSREWRPIGYSTNIRVNDATDVDISGGLNEGYVLKWNDSNQSWVAQPGPDRTAGDLGDLNDVDTDTIGASDGDTLIYSDAAGAWVPGKTPANVYSTLDSLEDTDVDGARDGQYLQYQARSEKWEAVDSPDPVYIDDLADVNTSASPPQVGQILAWRDGEWRPSYWEDRGAAFIDELGDVDTRNKRSGQGLVWNGSAWAATELAAGRGDAGDFDTTYTAVGFVTGVFGGGDFDITGPDLPVERRAQFMGGGDFD